MELLKKKQMQYVYFGILAIVLPLFLNIKGSYITLLGSIGIFSIATLGYNVLLGYAGQISLGHGAFMGLGAYFSAYLVSQMELPWIIGLLAAALVPFVVGLLLGVIALRLEGHYLAIATLGLAVVIQELFAELLEFTGGWSGTRAEYPSLFGVSLSKVQTYILIFTVLVTLMILTYNFIKAATGRALIAMKKSEHAAQAMGISLFKYKLLAFAISTMYAGIAGCLYMHFFKFCEPTLWGFGISLDILGGAIIGGLGTIGGAVVGMVILKFLPTILQIIPLLRGIDGLSLVLTGVAIVVVIMFYPKGAINIGEVIINKFKHKKDKTKLLEDE